MEEKKKKKILLWCGIGLSYVVLGGVAIYEAFEIRSEKNKRETSDVKNTNLLLKLTSVNQILTGENNALVRENKKLGRENANLIYQLGKKEAEKRQSVR